MIQLNMTDISSPESLVQKNGDVKDQKAGMKLKKLNLKKPDLTSSLRSPDKEKSPSPVSIEETRSDVITTKS